MKMVASSKLLKSQRGITGLRQYAAGLKLMVGTLNRELLPQERSRFTLPGENKRALLVSIASNKGLCGTYNALVIKRTIDQIRVLEKEGFQTQLLLVGRKAEEYFRKREFTIYQANQEVIEHVNYKDSAQFASNLMDLFDKKEFGRIDVVYNHFKNAVFQELMSEQLLPVAEMEIQPESSSKESKFQAEDPTIILEPSRQEMAEALIPKYIQFNAYRILLDASASEHGARMTAMQKATDNATELLKNLTLAYNKVRQAQITREIVEIVSGAEVLNE
jgi:F-type H+-transporting ATPase subunit gamma